MTDPRTEIMLTFATDKLMHTIVTVLDALSQLSNLAPLADVNARTYDDEPASEPAP